MTMWPRPKLVIPYLGPHGAARSRTRIRHWFRDIWLEVGRDRISKNTCIALADECHGRAARIHSFPKSVGSKLDNASEPWSREHVPTTAQCHCDELGKIDPAMIDPATKHVRCTNVSTLIESWCSESGASDFHASRWAGAQLQNWIKAGREFRSRTFPKRATEAIWGGNTAEVKRDAWLTILGHADIDITTRRDMILTSGYGNPVSTRPPKQFDAQWWRRQQEKDEEVLKIAKHLQGLLTITRVDKSENNLSFVCKELYRSTILSRLSNSADFEALPDLSPEEEMQMATKLRDVAHSIIRLQVDTRADLDPNLRFPTMIATTKQKKLVDPTKTLAEKASLDMWRFITSADRHPVKLLCDTHVALGKMLDKAYYDHCMMRTLQAKTMMGPSRRGRYVRFYHQAKEVTHIIKNMPKRITSVANGDHSKMFESLPHDGPAGLKQACLHKFRLATLQKRACAALVNPHTGKAMMEPDWNSTTPPMNPWVRIDLDTYDTMLELILEATIVKVGGSLYRQRHGVPMGFSDSPLFSQDFFDYHDYRFADNVVAHKDWDRAGKVEHMHRVADDVLCFNSPDFFKTMAESWGRVGDSSVWDYISLNDETIYSDQDGRKIGASAHMCDVTFTIEKKHTSFKLYDKLRHMKRFSQDVIRYPMATSVGPHSVLHSIIQGQMSRFMVRSREFSDFLDATLRLVVRLLGNNFPFTKVRESIKGFSGADSSTLTWEWNPRYKQLTAKACKHVSRTFDPSNPNLTSGVEHPVITELVNSALQATLHTIN